MTTENAITTLTRWTDVTLYRADGFAQPRSIGVTGDDLWERIEALREYRATGAIAGYYLCEPSDDPDMADADASAGPSVNEIDWTGFPYSYGPRHHEIVALLESLPTLPWMRPTTELDAELIQRLIDRHVEALSSWGDVSLVPVRIVRTRDEWIAARGNMGQTPWSHAAGMAQQAAVDAVDDDDGRRLASQQAWRGAFSALPRLTSWATRIAGWEAQWLVADMKRPSPWRPLVDLMAMGLFPLGVVDGAYVIYAPESTTGLIAEG